MKLISATDAKNRFGELLDQALQEPVEITKQGRRVVVMLSAEKYAEITESTQANKKSEAGKRLLELVKGLPTTGTPARIEDYHQHLDEKYS